MSGLELLVGVWTISAGEFRGRCEFEWMDGKQLLLQRTHAPSPMPGSLCVIAPAAGGGWTQHYFDTRGVVRLYEMTIGDGVWQLRRTVADFSPLNFSQRFRGVFGDGNHTIRGTWEKTDERGAWMKDFELVYRRLR